MAERNGKTLLTPDDWTRAALDAIGSGGVGEVAVDRLAKALGVSRGSFYWHFKDRAGVIEAALERWARENTTDLARDLEAIADPVDRLRALLRTVYERPVDAVELRLSASGDDPVVGPAVARVTKERLAILRRIFTGLGLDDPEAADRAWLAYAFYIGHHQLAQIPGTATARPDSLDRVVDLLVSGVPAGDAPQGSADPAG